MKPYNQDFPSCLRTQLNGRVCIVGVGNRQRGDDGAGPRVIDARDPAATGIWLDAGTAPENFLETVANTKPDTVLIVDAVSFGGFPGECRLMDATEMNAVVISTHAGSLGLLSDYLSVRIGVGVQVLAIQPKRIDAREELSQPVETTVRELSAMLSEILRSRDSDGQETKGHKET